MNRRSEVRGRNMTQQERIQYNSYPTSDFGLLTSGTVCPPTFIQALRFGIPLTGVRLYFQLYRVLSISSLRFIYPCGHPQKHFFQFACFRYPFTQLF